MAEVLDEDDLRRVYDALYSLRAIWWEVGLQLKVKPATLDAIQHNSSSHDNLMQVLLHWLRNAPRPTWPDIVEALRRPTVDRRNTAEKVRRKYCSWYEPQLVSLPSFHTHSNSSQPAPNVVGEFIAYQRSIYVITLALIMCLLKVTFKHHHIL